MALNVSSSQIYAGRYHYEKPVTANLLDKEKYPGTDSKQLAREVYVLDTVTFSDEGLARAVSGENTQRIMRRYLIPV